MLERTYQKKLLDKIRTRFKGCVILKNDPTFMQGIPDILILFKNTWAMLEVKMAESSSKQSNQAYYVRMFGKMSFASFINPANEEEVLDALQSAFESAGKTRVSKSK